MKGPRFLTLLMLMSMAIYAYADASTRGNAREAGLFGRSTARPAGGCPLGAHYSSFYHDCRRTVMPVAFAATK